MSARPAARRLAAAFCLAACLGAAPAGAQQAQPSVLEDPVVRFQVNRGLSLLYNVQFEGAARLFDQVDRLHPEHPIGPFLKALGVWQLILLDLGDAGHDAAFFAAMDQVIARADRRLFRNRNDFDAAFFKGAALGFKGRLHSNRGEWFRAAVFGRQAMGYVLRVARRDPGNPDYAFGKGMYDYYAVVLPEKFPLTRAIAAFLPEGDRAGGLARIRQAAAHGLYLRTEAAYFLLQIAYLFENDFGESLRQAQWLRAQYPRNPFFHTFEARVYARWGYWDRANAAYAEVLRACRERRRGYNAAAAEQALYYLARGDMAYGRYAEAAARLAQIPRAGGRDPHSYFRVWGRLREGMAYDALGRRDEAARCYRDVLAMRAWGDARQRARRLLAAQP